MPRKKSSSGPKPKRARKKKLKVPHIITCGACNRNVKLNRQGRLPWHHDGKPRGFGRKWCRNSSLHWDGSTTLRIVKP